MGMNCVGDPFAQKVTGNHLGIACLILRSLTLSVYFEIYQPKAEGLKVEGLCQFASRISLSGAWWSLYL